ncbi:MAG TPA: DNA ligase D [Burkholderiales bacterium]|nr:DNA ligase D [Burkholderiales bacterium]
MTRTAADARTRARPALERYHHKRDFGRTPEPRGRVSRSKAGHSLGFFIQRHHARALHYDFRLELDGVLKSWAVPKGPSLDPADKRLAIRVEDHPYDYGSFEGTIPPGQYGAGEVVLWDRGTWAPEGDAHDGLRKGHIKFALKGEKLNGRWALVRMGRPDSKKENWLLIKEHDDQAREGKAARITEREPDSVAKPRHSRSSRKKTRNGKAHDDVRPAAAENQPVKIDLSQLAGAVQRGMPQQVKPQLATLSARAPEGDEWISEAKFDGYRALTRIVHGRAQIYTREGHDWSERWPALVDALSRVPVKDAWLDGEVVAYDDEGNISFEALQAYGESPNGRLACFVFDLPYVDGYDLTAVPLIRRKEVLRQLIPDTHGSGYLFFSDHISGDTRSVFEHACMHGMEGIVAKRADARYAHSRNRDWLKVKCEHRQEFVIAGYTDPAGHRSGFGALLLAVYDPRQKLHYAGRVGTGFDEQRLEALMQRFGKLGRRTAPVANPPSGRDARGVHWLEPKLVAEVRFAQWTKSGVLRQASFLALREDKDPRKVVREQAQPAPAKGSAPAAAAAGDSDPDGAEAVAGRRRGAASRAEVAGVTLSHASRVLFPRTAITKIDLAHYYETVAERMLPYLRERPLAIVRCPQGGGEKCFFQKHVGQGMAGDIGHVEVTESHGKATYMTVDNVSALVGMVQMGVLELHTWGSRKGRLMQPDRIIFDLDPAPDVAWERLVTAARLVRGLLQEVGLTSFVKTTGGKGLHVVAPIRPQHEWAAIKAFTRAIAEHLEQTLPDHFISRMTKAARGGKIFVDYLRNAEGATAVAEYSTRAKPNAPVATPIGWDELTSELRSDSYTVSNLPQRLEKLRSDPWADYFGTRQSITTKMLKTF